MARPLTPIDEKLQQVVLEAQVRGFTVRSDFARQYAEYLAMAASLGLVSTKIAGNVYSSEWRPTIKGLAFLEEVYGRIDDE
jgi:hypothetical protein